MEKGYKKEYFDVMQVHIIKKQACKQGLSNTTTINKKINCTVLQNNFLHIRNLKYNKISTKYKI